MGSTWGVCSWPFAAPLPEFPPAPMSFCYTGVVCDNYVRGDLNAQKEENSRQKGPIEASKNKRSHIRHSLSQFQGGLA